MLPYASRSKPALFFIPLISRNTHEREEGYFRLEWKLAVDRSHLMAGSKTFLLPVVIDDTRDDDDRVPDRFRDVQWTRLPEGHASDAFVERVAKLLGAERDAGSPAAATVVRPAEPVACAANATHAGSVTTKSNATRALAAIAIALVVLFGGVEVYRALAPRHEAVALVNPASSGGE